MKIAICKTEGFCSQWVDYCEKNRIDYKMVNPYDFDIIKQVVDCECFMWHFSHVDYRDNLFAKQLIYSLEMAGKKCFPNYYTTWHFDDKVGQKYLLESINAPLVQSYVFYTPKEALAWIEKTEFPKVFKLRGGAGATNVLLAHTKSEARKLTRTAFSRGFLSASVYGDIKERHRKWKSRKVSFVYVMKGLVRFFIKTDFFKMSSRHKGYIYFQDFISDNDCDFRIKVVYGRCWGFLRKNRNGDFRASGSGNLIFDTEQIPLDMIQIAFEVSKKLKLQSVAFDFVIDKKNNTPLIVEMSYCFGIDSHEYECGYWTEDMQWHEGEKNDFCGWMVENVIKEG